MSSHIPNDLGSQTAFPSVQSQFNQHANGLTKRELFAAMAMQGMCANPERWSILDESDAELAAMAVGKANALLAALDGVTK